jgi:hypothetical protein
MTDEIALDPTAAEGEARVNTPAPASASTTDAGQPEDIALDPAVAEEKIDTLEVRVDATEGFAKGPLSECQADLKDKWDAGGLTGDYLSPAKEAGELFAGFLDTVFQSYPSFCDSLVEGIDQMVASFDEADDPIPFQPSKVAEALGGGATTRLDLPVQPTSRGTTIA